MQGILRLAAARAQCDFTLDAGRSCCWWTVDNAPMLPTIVTVAILGSRREGVINRSSAAVLVGIQHTQQPVSVLILHPIIREIHMLCGSQTTTHFRGIH